MCEAASPALPHLKRVWSQPCSAHSASCARPMSWPKPPQAEQTPKSRYLPAIVVVLTLLLMQPAGQKQLGLVEKCMCA